uniref:alpha-mannosidase n=1 Tax=Syphacia muris TaxID=451379 RepID=A0A0N5ATD1_9BILA
MPLYNAPLFNNERTTFERVEKFISKDYFTDCNLFGRLYGQRLPVELKYYCTGQTPLKYSSAVQLLTTQGGCGKIGLQFGPTWSTCWFQIDITVPDEWKFKDVVFRFDAQCEALVWNTSGRPIIGLSSDVGRTDLKLPKDVSVQRYYVEAVGSGRNGDGNNGMINPVNMDKKFELKMAEIRVRCNSTYELYMDFEILLEMARLLPEKSERRYEALYLANDLINELIRGNFTKDVIEQCHFKASKFIEKPNGSTQFHLYAIGNCHIDTAWLWRYEETRRKCARSWANVVSLMNDNCEMTFAISQAQQLSWLRQDYPLLFEEIQDLCAEGRISAVGGSWVEFDGNMPSGESLIRQLLYGQKEFNAMFGKYSQILWLPDTFGFPAQLPQIMKHCGVRFFLTQKLSWSLVNKFPHNTFLWRGLDGAEVLAHFPPHSYVAQVTVKECLESAANFSEYGRSNVAAILYGHGDGGGGPDQNMLERIKRLKNCDGVPCIVNASPEELFEKLECDLPNLCSWNGELYLELHNGTYTTQSRIKKMNRLLETILRDHEFLQSLQLLECGCGRALSDEWKLLLLNQFHDVLPGTCISAVVDDALSIYNDLLKQLTEDDNTLKFTNAYDEEVPDNEWIVNSLNWDRVIVHNNMLLHVPPLCIWPLRELDVLPLNSNKQIVQFIEASGIYVFTNEFFTAHVNKMGQIVSYVVKCTSEDGCCGNGFEAVSETSVANCFVVFDDVPLYWDAWDVMDYHLETRMVVDKVYSTKILENSPLIARIQVKLSFGKSCIKQEIICRFDLPYLTFHTFVDWQESHKFLKVEFPVNVNSSEAFYDTQYGYVKRSTHQNTSWDSAKFEVCAHKWMALSEYNRGVAVINNCKYGHSCDKHVMRLSLLRASKAPDENADIGTHEFSYAFFPFTGAFQNPLDTPHLSIIRAAYDFNIPVRFVRSWSHTKVSDTFSIIGSDGIIIDAMKPCEDDLNAIAIRLFESFGGGCQVRLQLKHGRVISVDLADGLERAIQNLPIEPPIAGISDSDSVLLNFRAFELKTIIIHLFEI